MHNAHRRSPSPSTPFSPPPDASGWRVLAELLAYISSNGRYLRGIILSLGAIIAALAKIAS